MKKIFLSILALSLFSCDVELIDPTVNTTDNTGGSGGDSNPTSGDYFPMAQNNLWIYNDGTANSEMKITGTETFNNKNYFKCNNFLTLPDFGAEATIKCFLRKADNKYYMNLEATLEYLGQVTVTKLSDDYILLNDNLPVGGTWTQNLTIDTAFTFDGQPVTSSELLKLDGKILQKLTNYSVSGTTYNDVIKVEIKETQGVGTDAETSTNIIYFAKGVGIIQSIDIDNEGQTTNTNLVSYSLN